MITNAQKINYKYLSLCPPDRVAAEATALFAYMHMQIACSVRVPLCTCCALCAIKHMNVLKGCWERDIVRPPTPVQITPELPTVTVFYSRVARHLVGSREKQCGNDGDDLNTAVASHYRGEAVMRLSSQPYI